MTVFAENLKKRREEFGVSRNVMARELHYMGFEISSQTIGNWERGKTTPDAKNIEMMDRYFEGKTQNV